MQRSLWIAGLLLAVALVARTTARGQSEPGSFPDIDDHFKYGSIGTEERVGVPYWIWRVLPIVFEDKLPKRPGRVRAPRLRLRRRRARAADRHAYLAGRVDARRAELRDVPCRHVPRDAGGRGGLCSACRRTRWTCRAMRAS